MGQTLELDLLEVPAASPRQAQHAVLCPAACTNLVTAAWARFGTGHERVPLSLVPRVLVHTRGPSCEILPPVLPSPPQSAQMRAMQDVQGEGPAREDTVLQVQQGRGLNSSLNLVQSRVKP